MISGKSRLIAIILSSAALGAALFAGVGAVYRATSKNDSCMSCHYHEEGDAAWKKSVHFNNPSGTKTDCAACHLPPEGTLKHFTVKTKIGLKDLVSYIFKKKEDIDWKAKSDLQYATGIVFNESCKECHVNLLPEGISDDGVTAHLYYQENEEKKNLQCISCHLDVGHYNPNYSHAKMAGVPKSVKKVQGPAFESAAVVEKFENFTETVPGTHASIRMVAIPGGSFTIGSPENEYGREADEGPRKNLSISPFFMAEVEITWDQFWEFYADTFSEGRIPPEVIFEHNSRPGIDAVSGPTPPYGMPDQGWGEDSRPAITMTYYNAATFCQWLSLKTGRTYRLPTEAEWEYAARGGTEGPFFFDGTAKKYMKRDTTVINTYVIYKGNSSSRTAKPDQVLPNPFGLKNMLGNVMEYCSDWYAPDAYASLSDGEADPKGPESGTEHVVRGGLYSSDAKAVRCAARDHTRHDEWLNTDPQMPKSIWWYSDIKGIGFRVVCELPDNLKNNQ